MSAKHPRHAWSDRRVLLASTAAGVLSLPLMFLHPMFALLGAPICAFASHYPSAWISRTLFKKEFQPPLGFPSEWDATRRASDWVLSVLASLVFVALLFVFGEIGDCLGGNDVWQSGWQLCRRPEA